MTGSPSSTSSTFRDLDIGINAALMGINVTLIAINAALIPIYSEIFRIYPINAALIAISSDFFRINSKKGVKKGVQRVFFHDFAAVSTPY